MTEFDYIVVGAGSAGSVVINRLASQGHRLCVIEAGGKDTNIFIHMPVGFVKTLVNPRLTYQFTTEPSEGSGGRRINLTQGKTLGGSSSINGLIFVRGQAADYNHWAQLGNRGWGYDEILPHFKGLENRMGGADLRYRGTSGELPITDPDWTHPLCDAFIEAAQSAGLPRNKDYNGASQEGAGYYQRAVLRGRRMSAARAFLYPVMKQDNVRMITEATVEQILLQDNKAVGVRYKRGSETTTVTARREIIVCAGAINSPRLLQLSGIGNPAHLKRVGVSVKHALPGVGENLMDHISPRLVIGVKNSDTINNYVKGMKLAWALVNWAMRRPSVLNLSPAVCHAFAKSDPAMDNPDHTIIFTPASYKQGHVGKLDDYPGMTSGVWQMRPNSRGHVRIRSASAYENPEVQPNYLQEESDQAVVIKAIRNARRILESPPMAPFYDVEKLPGKDAQTDGELLSFARQYGNTAYHLAGTCKMGPRDQAGSVVDDELRVHGLRGLRVADSSIMPSMVSANTYATTLMIGSKCADLLKAS